MARAKNNLIVTAASSVSWLQSTTAGARTSAAVTDAEGLTRSQTFKTLGVFTVCYNCHVITFNARHAFKLTLIQSSF